MSMLNAFAVDIPSLSPKTAPISSRRGVLIAFSGATLDFDATILVDTVPSAYSHLEYTTAPYASAEA